MFCFIFLTNIFGVLRDIQMRTYKYNALCQASYVTEQPNKTGLVTILLKLGIVIDKSISRCMEYIDCIYKIKLCYAERSHIEWARSSAR